MTKRQAVRAAKRRGLIDEDTARSAAPVRHRRVCPMCGGKFTPDNPHRLFCNCGCCAVAWGKRYDAEEASPPEVEMLGFRWMRAGDRVVVLATGRSAVLVSVSTAGRCGEAIVEIDGELIHVGPKEVEKVLGVAVTHTCGRDRNPFAAAAKKGAEHGGETEVAGCVSRGEAARRSDREHQHAGSTGLRRTRISPSSWTPNGSGSVGG